MTLRLAERITGLTILQCYSDPPTYKAWDDQYHDVATATGTEKQAAESLVRQVYAIRCEQVFTRAKWKCEQCGRRRPLQVHHKVFRSHGRRDTLENLLAVCQLCHEAIHRGK